MLRKLVLVQSHGTMGTLVSNLSTAYTIIFLQTQFIVQVTSTNTVKKLISTFLAKCTKWSLSYFIYLISLKVCTSKGKSVSLGIFGSELLSKCFWKIPNTIWQTARIDFLDWKQPLKIQISYFWPNTECFISIKNPIWWFWLS